MDRKIRIIKAKPLSEKVPREQRPRRSSNSRPARGGARASSNSRKREYKPRHNDDHSVYVGNLSFRTTEMKLGRHFENYGEIKDVRIVEDDKERSRGFGYVEFETVAQVEKALEADGTELDGRKVRVAKVQRRERKNKN